MNNVTTSTTTASQEYAKAYLAHYTTNDLSLALQGYTALVTGHPRSAEADYARMQIFNIVTTVVPASELMDVQLKLALDHLQRARRHD